MIAIPLAKKIAELFLILFTTAALVRGGVLKTENSKVLSKLSLYFITPCVIFNSFQKELTPEIQQGLLTAAALAVFFELLFFLFADKGRGRKDKTELIYLLQLVSQFLISVHGKAGSGN